MMKKGNAVCLNDIPLGIWKCLGEVAVEFLTKFFKKKSEKMSNEGKVLVTFF